MSIGLILVIILVIFLLGGFSGRFGGYGYGYGHGGDRCHPDHPRRTTSHREAVTSDRQNVGCVVCGCTRRTTSSVASGG